MVLENMFKVNWIEKRPIYSLLIGMIYTVIGYVTARIFFGSHVSIAMLFLTTLLLLPSVIKIITIEEKIERRDGIRNFFKNHKEIFEIFLFMFIGIFIVYLAIGLFTPSFETVFDYQVTFLEERGSISATFFENPNNFQYSPSAEHFFGIMTSNFLTVLIFFILSLFYGAGGIFLILLNASIFSSFIVFASKFARAKLPSLLGAFSIHMIPEVSAFLLAAIAGGVVSKAIIMEKFGSRKFNNVLRDGIAMLIIAFVIIIIAAFLETYVSAPIFNNILR